MSDLNKKVLKATKWSFTTEVVSKLITPITNMVLARLLAPEAFGVITTIVMIISFAELFTDAGFHKYLVQHDFKDDEDLEQSTNVAFWSNFTMSLLAWLIIIIFAEPLASSLGNPGKGIVIIIACIVIPLASFSSIQMALYRRHLDFYTLFKVRFAGIITPLIVTIPLALIFRNFWALIIGMISKGVVNAVLLTYFSSWKPRFFYSWVKFKEMISFTIWSFFESFSIWLTGYLDVFFISSYLSQHYLGLYKTSSVMASHILGLIVTATTPILFSSLSRLQNNMEEFKKLFFKFQKSVGLFVLPMGVGMFCMSDFVTDILLGSQWVEGAPVLGLWGLTSSIMIVLSHYASEAYRAVGKPKLSVLAQWLHIIVLLPTVYISVQYGFKTLYIARSCIRAELIAANMVIMYYFLKISPIKMVANVLPSLLSSVLMGVFIYFFRQVFNGFIADIITILLAMCFYGVCICLFKEERSIFKSFVINKLLKKGNTSMS